LIKDRSLIVIGGPTASGKTKMAIELAKKLNCEIISADSRQVYKEISIGTAKPTQSELQAAPHHFIDHVSIHDTYNAGIYEEEVIEKLDKLFEKNNFVILVGGTGLYIQAVCNGLDEFPEITEDVRLYYHNLLKDKGLECLLEILKAKDPHYFEKVDQQNPRRITRALEIMHNSELKYSEMRTKNKKIRNFNTLMFLIDIDRPILYERINNRVIEMVQNGLFEEVESLLPYQDIKATQTVGYQEIFKYFNGELKKDESIEKIQQNSRRYAKRQMTWFNNQLDSWIKIKNINEIIIELENK